MKVNIYSRSSIEELIQNGFPENTAVISFYTPGKAMRKENPVNYQGVCDNVFYVGIHDIDIEINQKSARLFASQGQQRSLALAMKLGEGEIAMEYSGDYPVFLFDDVLSELDVRRQKFLLSRIKDRQVIMTTCTPPPVESTANFIDVRGGSYTPR